MQELFELISNYGFPIVVAGYLLFRQEKKMDRLSNLITQKDGLDDKISEILEIVKEYCKRRINQ